MRNYLLANGAYAHRSGDARLETAFIGLRESAGAPFLMAGRLAASARKRIHDSRKPAKRISGFPPFAMFGFLGFLFGKISLRPKLTGIN